MKIIKLIIFLGVLPSIYANDVTVANNALFAVNNTWMLVSTFLVFIMHLGFASLETGLTQSKNTVNILFKNVSIIAIGILTYALCGFNLMYPGTFNGYFGFAGFGISSPLGSAGLIEYANGNYTYFTDFIFQAMFAATAATIVSGAVAERIKLSSFLLFSTIYVAFIYPVAGSWKWGAGWLDQIGFYDFAGSTLVHSVGGWAALIGAIILGPRIGKYSKDGLIKPIRGHNLPLASIGVFLLWFGWYGFNGGSVLSADPGGVSFVFVTTTLAGASGIVGAMIASWTISKKPDLSMILNGSLAGLVGITAGADVISPMISVIVGFTAGLIVVVSVIILDKSKIDDPVGAISVHLVCGIWGTIAVGIFSAEHSFITQLIGVIAYGIFCLITSSLLFLGIKSLIGLRVSEEEEIIGLDIGEHDMESYAGFQIFTIE
tara:strand:+ start:100 stop:1395 length:1296 start_codon:yes stop_codon:yes gene_type:complete